MYVRIVKLGTYVRTLGIASNVKEVGLPTSLLQRLQDLCFDDYHLNFIKTQANLTILCVK